MPQFQRHPYEFFRKRHEVRFSYNCHLLRQLSLTFFYFGTCHNYQFAEHKIRQMMSETFREQYRSSEMVRSRIKRITMRILLSHLNGDLGGSRKSDEQ
jgi:hypothetical protein